MQGRIAENGYLNIKRGTKEKSVACPFDPNCMQCGDWCALFGEPNRLGELILCNKVLLFTELKDERK